MDIKSKYKILGLDNSRYCTGWGIVDVNNDIINLIDYGFIDTKKIKIEAETLIFLEKEFNRFIDEYNPDYIVAEQMFVGANRTTALVLAHVHGVMLLVAAKRNIPVTYYSVMTLKSCVLGGVKSKNDDGTKKSGDDLKEEVSIKVIETLGKENFKKPYNNDVTDALSAILTFINRGGQPLEKKIKNKKGDKNEKISKKT